MENATAILIAGAFTGTCAIVAQTIGAFATVRAARLREVQATQEGAKAAAPSRARVPMLAPSMVLAFAALGVLESLRQGTPLAVNAFCFAGYLGYAVALQLGVSRELRLIEVDIQLDLLRVVTADATVRTRLTLRAVEQELAQVEASDRVNEAPAENPQERQELAKNDK